MMSSKTNTAPKAGHQGQQGKSAKERAKQRQWWKTHGKQLRKAKKAKLKQEKEEAIAREEEEKAKKEEEIRGKERRAELERDYRHLLDKAQKRRLRQAKGLRQKKMITHEQFRGILCWCSVKSQDLPLEIISPLGGRRYNEMLSGVKPFSDATLMKFDPAPWQSPALKDASDEELMQKVDELISELTGMKLGGNMMGGSAGAEEEDSEEESEVSEEE